MAYVLISHIADWEAGEWPERVPPISRFDDIEAAKKAYEHHRRILNQYSAEESEKVAKGAAEGYLIAMGGHSVVNTLFRTTKKGTELSAQEFEHLVVASECYGWDYEFPDRTTTPLSDLYHYLDQEDLEEELCRDT